MVRSICLPKAVQDDLINRIRTKIDNSSSIVNRRCILLLFSKRIFSRLVDDNVIDRDNENS